MRILALQLKRIGDLVLTTPALEALRARYPKAEIALALAPGTFGLFGAMNAIDFGIVLGEGRGFAPWQQLLTGTWDMCFDFTGNDRSALATVFSRARERVGYRWVRQKSFFRSLAYSRLVDSPVRSRHTVDHALDLVGESTPHDPVLWIPSTARKAAEAVLQVAGIKGPFAVVHPGSARPEKYWLPERWAAVIASLPCPVLITGGTDPFEMEHVGDVQRALANPVRNLCGRLDLLTVEALISRASVVLSCDTAAVHLAAAFQRPQIALFGPTNPFHWRPRHANARVISAAEPAAPMREFSPQMKGAPMERIPVETVTAALAEIGFSSRPPSPRDANPSV